MHYCGLWHEIYESEWDITLFSAFYIVVINVIMQFVFTGIGRLTKPDNVAAHYFNRTSAIFVSSFLNTAILINLPYTSFLYHHRRVKENNVDDIFVGPFDEFDSRWFYVVASPILLALIISIVTPHVIEFFRFLVLFAYRCFDRNGTLNDRRTRKVVQKDYEDLHIGPEFILQARYGQLLSMIFVAMTYSSSLPIVYAVIFAWILITYWVDKILLLRYYRLTEGYTRHLAQFVATTLPFSILFHCAFAIGFYSYPLILNSPTDSDGWGNNTQYFNPKRLGQNHVEIFIGWSIVIACLVIFESFVVGILKLSKRKTV